MKTINSPILIPRQLIVMQIIIFWIEFCLCSLLKRNNKSTNDSHTIAILPKRIETSLIIVSFYSSVFPILKTMNNSKFQERIGKILPVNHEILPKKHDNETSRVFSEYRCKPFYCELKNCLEKMSKQDNCEQKQWNFNHCIELVSEDVKRQLK